jgi:hypothetical protein
MKRDFFDPPLSDLQIVLVDERTLQIARSRLLGCESCDADAHIPLDWLLDQITSSNPTVTDYVIEKPLTCRYCGASITEKTLVDFE